MRGLGEEKVYLGMMACCHFSLGKWHRKLQCREGREKGWGQGGKKKSFIGALLQRFVLRNAQDLPQQQCNTLCNFLLWGLRWEEGP